MSPQDILRVEHNIVLALKNIYDPEIPVNIYDLGLIYEIEFSPDGVAAITMTMTAPNCPAADLILEDVRREVGKIDGISEVKIEITFDPPWDKDMISEEAKLDLGLL